MTEPEVIYETKDFLAISKPAGLLVHPIKVRSASFKEPTLVDWLLSGYPEIKNVGDDTVWRPGIVHRLDRTTSGVMVIPKTQEYFLYLKSLFQKSGIKKTYNALVFGDLHTKSGLIEKPIGIGKGTKRSVNSVKMVKDAKTEYKVLEFKNIEGQTYTLLKVMPHTGRTHQIRVHLAHIKHPVVGDFLYGPRRQPEWVKRVMLHAVSLEWTAEDGSRVKIESNLPEEFEQLSTV